MRYSIILIGLLFIAACTTPGNDSAADISQTETTGTESSSVTSKLNDSLVPRAVDANRLVGDFDFAIQAPILHSILSNRPELLGKVSEYAQTVLAGTGLTGNADVEQLLASRSALMPLMDPLLEAWDTRTSDYAKLKELDFELREIGMRVGSAEGMFIKLLSTSLPESVMQACTPVMRAHLNFTHAVDNTIGGEYPYSNMALFGEAVAAGEKLMADFSKSHYVVEDDTLLKEMVDVFTGLYLRPEGDYEIPAVGHPGDGMYEFGMSEMESHKLFLTKHPNSRYAPVIAKMIEQPSRAAVEPEELYIVYDRYFTSMEEAYTYKHQQLFKGIDVLHIIPASLGNGQENYLVSFRFFDNSDTATAYFTQKEKEFPEVKMMFTTLHNGKFVQAGI